MHSKTVFTAICSAILLSLSVSASAETVLHVSPDGNDANKGTRLAPLASLEGARARVRTIGRSKPITVIFAEGTYAFTKPVSFTGKDSGTEQAPIVYKAAPGADVRFTGGVPLRGWQTVTDPDVLRQLHYKAKPHVRVVDLRAMGIRNLGELEPYGFGKSVKPAPPALVTHHAPLTLARWPNQGFRGATGKLDTQRVVVDTARMSRWVDEQDPWVFAYWHHSWAELAEPIVGFDPKQRVIERSKDIIPLKYGITPDKTRWYAFNLLSELDTPGEYVIDRQNGLAYYWPVDDGPVELTQAIGFIDARELRHVTFQGFTMEACRGTAVFASLCRNVRIVGCTLRYIGARAVYFQQGRRNEVFGCDISYIGADGIVIGGGDTPRLIPAEHNVENNHIHHYAQRYRSYKGAVQMSGVGMRVAHNLIHHGPHTAIVGGGNDHVVEFNEVHNVIQECGDAGALYQGRSWHRRGTQIRHNYWHNIKAGVGWGMVIYQDDQNCGQIIHGNVFENVTRAVYLGGGRDHIVENNVFANCWRSVYLDDRGIRWPNHKEWVRGPDGPFHEGLRSVPYQNDLWRKRYPKLATILQDQPGVPKGNIFRSNISAGGTWDDIKPSTKKDQTIKNNLAFDEDPGWIRLVKDRTGKLRSIRFRDMSAAHKAGFKTIPVAKIGLYADPRRASWPVPRQVEIVNWAE